MKNISRVLILVAFGVSPSCATILQHGPDAVSITTIPPGALVKSRRSGQTWTTPTVMKLSHSSELSMLGAEQAAFDVTFPGYEKEILLIDCPISGTFFISAFILPAAIIDILTYNSRHIKNDPIMIELRPYPGTVAPASKPTL